MTLLLLETLLSYLVSLAASVRNSSVDKSRADALGEQLSAEAAKLESLKTIRPLDEEFADAFSKVVAAKSHLGIQQHETALVGLLSDPVFIAEVQVWMLADTLEAEREAETQISVRLVEAIDSQQATPDDIERFREQCFDQLRRQLYSNQLLSNWRQDRMQRATQQLVVDSAQQTQGLITNEGAALRQHIDTTFGAIVPTKAKDVGELRRQSDAMAAEIQKLSSIQVNGEEIKLERNVVAEMVRAALGGSMLVVGDPGAGKSTAMEDLHKELRRLGHDTIFLDVNKLESGSLGNLQSELNIDHPILDVMNDWPGREPVFLLIDAIDAARSTPALKMIRQLIGAAHSIDRWTIVASVRKYDLRYDETLRRTFRGSPPSEDFSDPEFSEIRHVNVPLFDDADFATLAARSNALGQLFSAAHPPLLRLLRVPFNLRLCAELLSFGLRPERLVPIQTQVELLDRFWKERVIRDDGKGDAREAVAFDAARKMVERRDLKVSRHEIARDVSVSEPLGDLLSSYVLAEWAPSEFVNPDRYILSFSHNTLFDFAVELAVLRLPHDQLAGLLSRYPDLILAIRPSLVYHFHRLWFLSKDHREFWDATLNISGNADAPRLASLIGPSVAVELGRDSDDFEPLYQAIESDDPELRDAAGQIVCHVASTLLARKEQVTGPEAGPWALWIERVSRSITPATSGALSALLGSCTND